MNKLLKTTLATAFAAACLAGTSIAFAGDYSGSNSGKDTSSAPRMNDNDAIKKTDPTTTGSIKCDNSNANIHSGCDKPGHLKQEQKRQQQ